MRVLMVTSFPIPGEYDGTAMLPIKIMRALRAARRGRGHGLLASPAALGSVAYAANSRGRRSMKFRSRAGRPVVGLKRIAREHPFDLVHAQHYGGATRAYGACRRYGWPMVYEIHSLLGDEVARDSLGRGLVFKTYRALEKRVLRHAAAVIVLGEPVKAGRGRRERGARRAGQRDLSRHRPG